MQKPIGQDNYEQFADRYAKAAKTKPHNAFYDRPAVISLLPDVNGLHVLDAGCGPGFYTEWLLEHGASVMACDVTPEMVEITRQKVGEQAEIHVADLAQPLTFAEDSTFDLIICPLVLDYIKDWRPTFKEFARVLKPDGIFVCSFGHPAPDFYKFNADQNYFDVNLWTMTWNGFGEPKPTITSYRRNLMEVFNPLLEAGLQLDFVLEPQPTEDYKKADPEGYEQYMREPSFLALRAVKRS